MRWTTGGRGVCRAPSQGEKLCLTTLEVAPPAICDMPMSTFFLHSTCYSLF